ncbi:MAG: succinylglutamate desuccinylase/aspartoacylase family protein [Flavobacteriaceae bacterium]|nr:succinylglutamate desuccinylase/aspartoacylase family protein [Bacteroidia bacterium]NNK82518.1 succinylglutamate desuccinylase/aspartoacylase family protein [Flavobacteriaceae bacterium]
MTSPKSDILHILGEEIALGERREINFNVAKLHTTTQVNVPVLIERSKKTGPTILFTAGIHGDEVNGVEIVRQLIAKGINKPKKGTIICVPVINIFGFLHMERELPDGRDLNRMFPGSKTGSLASQVAFKLMSEIVPQADLIIDYHTGGADRFNSSQIRIVKDEPVLEELAEIFGAPFILYSKNIKKSFRSACYKIGVPILLFEGGKSFSLDKTVTNTGVNGAKRILNHLDMLNSKFKVSKPKKESVYISRSKWIRAKYSGMFKASVSINNYIKKGDVIGNITDPFGKFNHFIKANYSGYVFSVNEAPIVYKGDAIMHVSIELEQ